MSFAEVRIDASDLTNELNRILKRGYNMSAVMAQFSQVMLLEVEDKFDEQGPGWPALSDETLRTRQASASPKMLQDSGDLVNSILPDSGPDFAEVFTDKAYARYHIEGDGVPERDFFDINIPDVLLAGAGIITEEIARGR